MTLNEYQIQSRRTARYPEQGNNYIYPTLGLAGEDGEVANKIKKIQRDHHGALSEEVRQEILSELGDVLWYLTQLTTEFNALLDEVAQNNLDKLGQRLAQGKISGVGDQR